jgi:hypothetical protein
VSGVVLQNVAVALIVLGAVAFLLRRQIRRRAKPTALCGDCEGCAPVAGSEKGTGLVAIEGLAAKKR